MDLSLSPVLLSSFGNAKLLELQCHHHWSPGSSYIKLGLMALPTFLLRPPARSPSPKACRAGAAHTEQAEWLVLSWGGGWWGASLLLSYNFFSKKIRIQLYIYYYYHHRHHHWHWNSTHRLTHAKCTHSSTSQIVSHRKAFWALIAAVLPQAEPDTRSQMNLVFPFVCCYWVPREASAHGRV